MKRILPFLILCFLAIAVCPAANAEISIKDYMSYEFLDTQGYSGDMLRLVEINKAKTFGEQIPSIWSSNRLVRGWQKAWAYLDPATDYGDFGEHEIKIKSTWRDY